MQKECPKNKKVRKEAFKISLQNPNSNPTINYLLTSYIALYFH